MIQFPLQSLYSFIGYVQSAKSPKLHAESSKQVSLTSQIPFTFVSAAQSPPHTPIASSVAVPPQSPLQSISTIHTPLQSKFSTANAHVPSSVSASSL